MFRFEKFTVWQEAVGFAGDLYEQTRRFPPDERFGLISQIRRAGVSISSNIAEGSSRSSDNEFARYIEIAYSSLMEVVSQLTIANAQGMLDEEPFKSLYADAERLAKRLSRLRGTLLGKQGGGRRSNR